MRCHRRIWRSFVFVLAIAICPLGYALGIRLYEDAAAPSAPYPVEVGHGVSLSIAPPSSGEIPNDLQWYHNGNPIAGATSDTLILNSFTPAQAGNYEVRTADDRSNIITLNVQPDRRPLFSREYRLPDDRTSYRLVHTGRNGAIYIDVQTPDGNRVRRIDPGDVTLTPDFDIPHGNSSVDFFQPLSDGRFLLKTGRVNGMFEAEISTFIADASGQTYPLDLPHSTKVDTLTARPDGTILIGQNLFPLTGNYRHALSRLRSDGDIDSTFTRTDSRPGVLYQLHTTSDEGFVAVVHDSGARADRAFRLERFDAAGTRDGHFNAFYQAQPIRLLANLPAGKLLVAVADPSVGNRRTLFRLNADGTPDAAAGSLVYQTNHPLRVTADGTIFELAQKQVDDRPRWYLRILTLPGEPAPEYPFDEVGAEAPFNFDIIPNSNIMVVGDFTSFGGMPAAHAVRLDGEYRQTPIPPTIAIDVSIDYDPDSFATLGATLTARVLPTTTTESGWNALDDKSLPTASGNRLDLDASAPGRYQFRASNAAGTTYSRVIDIPAVAQLPRLVNLSARSQVPGIEQPATLGFVAATTDAPGVPAFVFRGIGPGLAQFIEEATVMDPWIQLLDAEARVIAANDDWPYGIGTAIAAVGAFPLEYSGYDAALVRSLDAGRHTLQLFSDPVESRGIGLLEAYVAGPNRRFVNLSVRAPAGVGAQSLIGGFVLENPGQLPTPRHARLLVRAVGPSLSSHGISDGLDDPVLKIFDASQNLIATNDDWEEGTIDDLQAATREVGAFPLLGGQNDAALLVELPAGAYTAVVESDDGSTGTALLELYVVPPVGAPETGL